MKKKLYTLGLAAVFAAMMTTTALAGQWVRDPERPVNENGRSNWWFQTDDGAFLSNGWYWLDGNEDGLAECYRFDENGWLYTAATVDGYEVDKNGAWVENGVIPRKSVDAPAKKPEKDPEEREKGSYAPGWKKVNGKQYCFDGNGEMLTGYQEVGGCDYYFYSNGRLATKTVHDKDEGVYYVIDEKEHQVIDVVAEEDWAEYKKKAI